MITLKIKKLLKLLLLTLIFEFKTLVQEKQ